jgi:hypothetical protein
MQIRRRRKKKKKKKKKKQKKEKKRKHTSFKPQYKMLIKTSMGALVTDRTFLILNSRVDNVISASKPMTKVTVARQSPRMVKC